MKNMVSTAAALRACAGFGIRYGAVAGAIVGTIVPLIGNLIGLVLGAVGGFVAGIVGGCLGGRVGFAIGGFVGGIVCLPQLNPFNVYYGGDSPRYFWEAMLVCIPAWIGSIIGLCVAFEIRKENSRLPRLNQLSETINNSPLAERSSLRRWLLRVPALAFIALGVWLCLKTSGFPNHSVLEYAALQYLSEEMKQNPNAGYYSVEGLEYDPKAKTLRQTGKKETWRSVTPEAIHMVAENQGRLGELTYHGAKSPYLGYPPTKKKR